MSRILSRRSFLVAAAAVPFWTACASGALPVPTATPAPAKPAEAPKPAAEPTRPAAAPTTAPAAAATKPAAAATTAPAAATSAPAAAAATKPAAAATPAAAAPATGGAGAQLTWWHHWVTEESKKKVINQFIDEYQKEKPNTKITIRSWEKAEMYPVARNAMTAGKDFPDIMYGPEDPFVTAGWVEDLAGVLDWSQFQDGAKDRTTRSVGGKAGVWEGPLESGSEEIYYNPRIFDKVGIKVPDDKQLTADEMLDAATKLRAGGFDPLAQGIGDRAYPGANLSTFSLLSAVGPDDFRALMSGKKEWTDPAVKTVLEWVARMAKVPAMPPSFATMNLAESHQYFHTPAQGKDVPRAGMFWIGAFYPGRAFVPPEKGGQPADFRLSFMKYPTFPGGKGTGFKIGGGGSGAGAVISLSKQKDAGLDIAKSFMNVKYGSLWLGLTYVPTELKTDPKQMPAGQYQWYAEEFAKTHQGQKYVTLNVATPPPLAEALKAALNEGLPQGQISVDKAIELLEKGRTAK
jgi:multiple sugar transport system substrate-binding protein